MSRNENGNPLMTEPRGPRWGRILGIVLVVLLAMVVLGGVGIYFYGHSLIGRANFVSDDQVKQLETLPAEAYEEDEPGEFQGGHDHGFGCLQRPALRG